MVNGLNIISTGLGGEVKVGKYPIVYSKKDGINRLLPIDTNGDLISLASFVEKTYPDEKDFVYVLIDGVEIKLF